MNTTRSHSGFWAGLGVFGITFAVFSGSLGHEFLNWDDPFYITQNATIQGLDGDHLKRIFTAFQWGFYAPLSQLSLAVDHALWGLNPAGYHLTNVLLHSLSAALVFVLAGKLTRLANRKGPYGVKGEDALADPSSLLSESNIAMGASLAALLFALHPLRVESVAWLSERRDVLSIPLSLLCVLTYLRGVTENDAAKRGRGRLGTLVLFVLAILAKTVAVMLPAVFLLLDVYPLNRFSEQRWTRLLLEKTPFLLVALGAGVGTIYGLGWGQMGYAIHSTEELGWLARIAQSSAANLHYQVKFLMPVGLNPLYKFTVHGFNEPAVWAGLIVTVGITLAGLHWFRRLPAFLIAWLSYLAIIGPFLGFVAHGPQFAADRYTYLPSVGLCILIGGLFCHGWNRGASSMRRPGLFAAAGLVLLLLGSRTVQQIGIWRDSETLWRHSVRLDPGNSMAWKCLGDALAARENFRESLGCYQRSLELVPVSDTWYNAGNVLLKLDRYAEAANAYRRVLVVNPQDAATLHNLGLALMKQNDFFTALRHLQIAEKLAPSPVIEYNLGRCWEQQGRRDEALRCYQSAAQQAFADAWVAWAELVAKDGDLPGAVTILKNGLERAWQTRLQYACAEMILREPRPTEIDLVVARKLITGLMDKTHGQNEKVKQLSDRLESIPVRQAAPHPAPESTIPDKSSSPGNRKSSRVKY